MSVHQTIVGFVVLAWVSLAHADELTDQIRAITDAPEYRASRWGMLVVDRETGQTIYEREPDRFFLPASVTKLYSCANALQELGPDHRFTTPVYSIGKLTDGVLDGELVLVASGDLTFGGRRSADGKTLFEDNDHTYANGGAFNSQLTPTNPLYALQDLAKQIARHGIKEVRGDVLIDDRLFARARSTGSGPEVLSPIIVNDNVIDVLVTPTKAGEEATVKIRPETAFINVSTYVNTTAGDRSTILIREVRAGEYRISGSIGEKAKPAVRVIDVNEPALFARALFIECLQREGIKITADLAKPAKTLPTKEVLAKQQPIAKYESERLADVLTVVLKVSHNLYASTLPILVGLKHGRGTIERGLQQQAKVLQDLGVDPKTVSFAGGAGGAQADSASPRATVALLRAMARHKQAEAYFKALPILGVDGTLAEAVGKDSPARGKVRAKTGTLSWYDSQNERLLMRSKALAGELVTAKGKTFDFAFFLNDVPLPPNGTTGQQGKVLGKLCEIIHQQR